MLVGGLRQRFLGVLQRSTKELLYRLRKQVPSTRTTSARGGRRTMGTGIFN
jgi:hypothetical protein